MKMTIKTRKKPKLIKINEVNLLQKDNHSLGCNLECYADVIRYRGYDREADMLDEVASKLK